MALYAGSSYRLMTARWHECRFYSDGWRGVHCAGDAEGAKGFVVKRPTARYSDVGGIQAILQEVRELIEYPLTHPEVYEHLGVEPPRGVLLHGPPGTGKSMLAHTIAGECGATFLKISAPEVVSGMSGESEQKLRDCSTRLLHAPRPLFLLTRSTPLRPRERRQLKE
jgi:ribosome biogenesis ATPase